MRDYIVLEQRKPPHGVSDAEGAKVWFEVATLEAANDQQAIRKATEDRNIDERAGTFVAVPARSFKARTRATETVVRDRWS
jgi:hypothetical protein